MKILHYGLGFSPERSGGLVKYSLSLMKEQLRVGYEVLFVYPGHIDPLHRYPYFKSGNRENIQYAELMNSLPLPLIGNIKKPDDFMVRTNFDIFLEFLKREKPDVIHLHTLMGLYAEFLSAANHMHIKVVYTTHDFFGISPNPKFYLDGHDFVDDPNYDIWNNIREYGTSTKKLRLVQLSIYPYLRQIIKKIKRPAAPKANHAERVDWNDLIDSDFQNLKDYYFGMLKNVSTVHFNSQVSKQVYHKFLPKMDWKENVIPITSEHVKISSVFLEKKNIKTIAYIGPYTEEKGFFDFIAIANEFLSIDKNHKAILMGDDAQIFIERMTNLGKYNSEEMVRYLKQIDLAILPSRWHETFGLIALEVLATGTKVIMTSKMGASDLVSDELKISNKKHVVDWNEIGNLNIKIPLVTSEEHFAKVARMYLD